jgi:RNA polymerase sigma-70 factor (ECF subfamily)
MTGRRSRTAEEPAGAGRDAFAAIYAEHFDDIYGYLCRRAGRSDGEELAAQTFALALRDLPGHDPARGSQRVWLFGIAAKRSSRAPAQ